MRDMGPRGHEGETVSRRFFLRAGSAGVGMMAAAALTELERQTRFIEAGAKTVYEIPDFLTFIRARDQFSSSPAFRKSECKIRPKNTTVLLGDSIMRGGIGDEPVSFADVFAETQKEERKIIWDVHNYAEHGVTTDMVMTQQLLSDRSQEVKTSTQPIKVFVHVGGNNIKGIANTQQKVETLRYLAINPRDRRLLDVVSDVMDDIRTYEKSFQTLLTLIVKTFGKQRIDNIVVFATPDLSKAPKISTIEVGDEMQYVPISNNAFAQFFVHQGTILLDTHMISATDKFKKNNPDINISAVNAFDLGNDCYTDDEHPNDKGKKEIADKLDRHLLPIPA